MSVRTTPPFRADHVGSFLRPQALLEARDRHQSGDIDAVALRTVEDEAIRAIVRFQEDAGMTRITDGWRRPTRCGGRPEWVSPLHGDGTRTL